MHLGRVIGRLVATHRYQGIDGVPLQLVSSGPGDTVHFIDGREAALACPETFVPVDATIMGVVEEATSSGEVISGSILKDS